VSAADSSWVGCFGGGGGGGDGLTALTAATFWVFLTLETAAFLAGAVLRLATFLGAFRAFADSLVDLAAGRCFAGLRDAVLAAVARLALGFAALALTVRFAVFADALRPAERDADRRRPFVRLLLIAIFLTANSVQSCSR
jgi:hypothetical protein